jgi:hypothetical protein
MTEGSEQSTVAGEGHGNRRHGCEKMAIVKARDMVNRMSYSIIYEQLQ